MESASGNVDNRRYRHPLGWYEFVLPAGWSIVQQGAAHVLRLRLADGLGSASISVSRAAHADFPPASLALLRRSLPGMRVIEAKATEGRRLGMRYARRDELLGPRPPWYLLWRRTEPASMLTTACFTRGRLMLVAAIHVPPDRAHRHANEIDTLLRSVRLAAQPAPPPQEFLDELVARARARYPERHFEADSEELVLQIDEARLSLDDTYRDLVEGRRGAEETWQGLVAAIALLQPSGLRLDDVETRLLPAIKPRWWIDRLDRRTPERQRLLRVPFPNDTVVVFAIDHSAAMRFVTVDEAERWELPPRLMLQQARNNLARRRSEIPLRAVVDGSGAVRAVVLHTGDGHDAARILLPRLRDKLSPYLGEDFVIAIPHRDLLIAFAPDAQTLRERILEHVRREICRQAHPITDRLFRLGSAWVSSA